MNYLRLFYALALYAVTNCSATINESLVKESINQAYSDYILLKGDTVLTRTQFENIVTYNGKINPDTLIIRLRNIDFKLTDQFIKNLIMGEETINIADTDSSNSDSLRSRVDNREGLIVRLN